MTFRVTSTTQVDLTAGSGPYGIAAAPDGAVWVTLVHSGVVVRLGADGGRDHYSTGSDTSRPSVVTVARDGTAWFTCTGDDRVAAVDTTGAMRTIDLRRGSGPFGICVAEDAVWVTESTADRLTRLDSEGGVRHVTLPDGCFPSFVTGSPDGTVWATLNQADAVAAVSPEGDVAILDISTRGAAPVGVTWGGDAVWVAEIGTGQIGRINTADFTVTEFPLPDPACRPHAIAAGAGGCWFTEWAVNRVGHIDRDGSVEEHDLPDTVSEPHGIAVAPDGAVWVAAESGAVVRLA